MKKGISTTSGRKCPVVLVRASGKSRETPWSEVTIRYAFGSDMASLSRILPM